MKNTPCSEIMHKSNAALIAKNHEMRKIEEEKRAIEEQTMLDLIESIKESPEQQGAFETIQRLLGVKSCIKILDSVLEHRAPYKSEITTALLDTLINESVKSEYNLDNLVGKISDPDLLSMVLFYATPLSTMSEASPLAKQKLTEKLKLSHECMFESGYNYYLRCAGFAVNLSSPVNSDPNEDTLLSIAESLLMLRDMNYPSNHIEITSNHSHRAYSILLDWESGHITFTDSSNLTIEADTRKHVLISGHYTVTTRETNFDKTKIVDFLRTVQKQIKFNES